MEYSCPALTLWLLPTSIEITVPDTSGAIGTTRAWTRAWEVRGLSRSETRYQVSNNMLIARVIKVHFRTGSMLTFTGFFPAGLSVACSEAAWFSLASCSDIIISVFVSLLITVIDGHRIVVCVAVLNTLFKQVAPICALLHLLPAFLADKRYAGLVLPATTQ